MQDERDFALPGPVEQIQPHQAAVRGYSDFGFGEILGQGIPAKKRHPAMMRQVIAGNQDVEAVSGRGYCHALTELCLHTLHHKTLDWLTAAWNGVSLAHRHTCVCGLGRCRWFDQPDELGWRMIRTHAKQLDSLLLFIQELKECHHYTMYGGQPKMSREDR